VEGLEICCGRCRSAEGARHGNHKCQDSRGHDLTPWSCRRAYVGPPTSGYGTKRTCPHVCALSALRANLRDEILVESSPHLFRPRRRITLRCDLERIPLRFEHSLYGERSSCTLLPRNRQRSVRSGAIDAEWCARRPCAGQPSLC